MRVAVSIALLLVAQVGAAPAPLPRPKPVAPARTFEIDFTPLEAVPPGKYEWRLDITVASKNGDPLVLTLAGPKEPGNAEQRVFHLTSLGIKAFDCTADESGSKLIVKGWNGSPPLSVEVVLKGLDKSYKPKVRGLPK